jgi:hypothetical protein
MTLPRGWPLLVLAGIAIALAVYAGPNQGVATGAAVGALIFIGLFLIGPAQRVARDPRPRSSAPPVDAASPFRAALDAGRSGRSEVVVLLDELERRSGHPDRPTTPAEEVARLRGLPRSEFRAYVRGRLDEIDGSFL